MAQTISLGFGLGAAFVGQLANLSAKIVDTTGSVVASGITTGFVALDDGDAGDAGDYGFTYTNYPNAFHGFVKIYVSGVRRMKITVNPTNVQQWLGNTPPTSTGAAGAVVADTTYLNGDLGAMSKLNDMLNAYNAGTLLGTDAISAAAVSAAAGAKIADIAHRRTMANVKASANGDAISKNSLYGFIQTAQKSSTTDTTLTVQNPDGSTLGTFTLSLDVNGLVTGIT